ncbi:sensor histidine kinase [Sinosporangium siamense]|uniref:sensor histidine kinase n=1 Tax=Sinosporangium siamense TaxID=1367973 RepID=UPI001950D9E6|nr:HAMP domain-containing sensor histidine kinase [Sinosporangium siamense]
MAESRSWATRVLGLPDAVLYFLLGVGGAVVLALALLDLIGSAVAVSGVLLGSLLAVLGGRRASADERAESNRLATLVERRAEQVTALSHELRTPLSMIKGASDLLLEGGPGPLTSTQTTFLRTIDFQCAQVIHLCESLLVQAKIESGLFTPAVETVDMSALTRDVVVAMRPLCATRDQRITLDTPQVSPEVQADPRLMVQAVTNLLSNAGRFTSVGGRIAVRVAVIDTGIAIYVTDDGAGMTRERRRELFRPFVSRGPLGDGTGLGLVITKTIVELHGGAILVDTAAMHGTTILLTLPFEGP